MNDRLVTHVSSLTVKSINALATHNTLSEHMVWGQTIITLHDIATTMSQHANITVHASA